MNRILLSLATVLTLGFLAAVYLVDTPVAKTEANAEVVSCIGADGTYQVTVRIKSGEGAGQVLRTHSDQRLKSGAIVTITDGVLKEGKVKHLWAN